MHDESEMTAWSSAAVEVEILAPAAQQPCYLATVPEFALHAEGTTFSDALDRAIALLDATIDRLRASDRRLPERALAHALSTETETVGG